MLLIPVIRHTTTYLYINIYRYNNKFYVSDCEKYRDKIKLLQPVLTSKRFFIDAKLTFINVEINQNEL